MVVRLVKRKRETHLEKSNITGCPQVVFESWVGGSQDGQVVRTGLTLECAMSKLI